MMRPAERNGVDWFEVIAPRQPITRHFGTFSGDLEEVRTPGLLGAPRRTRNASDSFDHALDQLGDI